MDRREEKYSSRDSRSSYHGNGASNSRGDDRRNGYRRDDRDSRGSNGYRRDDRDNHRGEKRRFDDRGGGGSNYRGNDRGGHRGGRGGGAGSGRAPADDSQTTAKFDVKPLFFQLDEIQSINIPPKASMDIVTNGYEISTAKAHTAYQYDIFWEGKSYSGKMFELNKQTKDDVRFQLKQDALKSLFYTLLHNEKEFFNTGGEAGDSYYSYDSGAMFFSQLKLVPEKESRTFAIGEDLFKQEVKNFYTRVNVVYATIKLTREIVPSNLNGDLENDRPAIQYLELVFNQSQRLAGKHLCFANKFYSKSKRDDVPIGDRGEPLVLKSGVSRSIRIIGEPTDNKLMVQLVPTKGTFYKGSRLSDHVDHIINRGKIWDKANWMKVNSALKGLAARTTYLERNKLISIYGISKEAADQMMFEYNGREISVAKYFDEKYRQRLRYPDYPCVVEKKGANKFFYPIEMLELPENQRVPKSKQSNDLNSKIIRQCQMLPSKIVEEIQKERDSADISNSNQHIKITGCRVDATRMITAPADQLQPPVITLKDTQKTLGTGCFGMVINDETQDKFMKAATVKKLGFILAGRGIQNNQAETFIKKFVHRLELYGVHIGKWDVSTWTYPESDVEKLGKMAQNDYDYVMIIGDDDVLHSGMKHMELSTKLVTQNVTPKAIQRGLNNNTFYDNLAFKFNLKAGGVNWSIASDSHLVNHHNNHDLLRSLMKNTLFFGIDISHPAGGRVAGDNEQLDPTTVGFASNKRGGYANMEKGDFGYQRARQSIVDGKLLSEKFINAIKCWYDNNTKRYPQWIIVYRAGLSEGEIAKIQQLEVPVFHEAIVNLKKERREFASTNCKLTVIMANRTTSYRIFNDEIDERHKAPQQNVPPGTCVSERIVSRKIPSFILVAQRALIGTARPTIYYVLDDAGHSSLDHLKWMTYCLCYAHGIVTSPTALPSPLVSAADLSKRARNNYKYRKINGNENDRSTYSSDSAIYRRAQGDVLTEDEKVRIKNAEDEHYKDLNDVLRAAIKERRFWA